MTMSAAVARTMLCLWVVVLLPGCLPVFDRDTEEEKNPLIADARARKAAYNYPGAIESLEKALEGNPRLALAHWELGLIYYQNVKDPAAAIYHFRKLLKLRPDWKQADTAQQFINVCEVEIAEKFPLRAQTPQAQRELDSLTAKIVALTRRTNELQQTLQVAQLQLQQSAMENAQLKEQLRVAQAAALAAQAQTQAARLSTGAATSAYRPLPPTSNQSGRTVSPPDSPASVMRTSPPVPQGTSGLAMARTTSALAKPAASFASNRWTTPSHSVARTNVPLPLPVAPAAKKPQTHKVIPGDTLAAIARKYGLDLEAVRAANPGLNPQRLRPGQTIRLPAR